VIILNKKKQFLKIGGFFIVLGFVALTVLIAIGFDERLNPSEEFPPFTSAVAGISGIGFIVGCVLCAFAIKGRKKRGKKY